MFMQQLHCDDDVQYPIEHLLKSVIILQGMAECEKETEMLKKKLHRYLMKATKEINGFREYAAAKYYPNGLLTTYNGYQTVLEGYKSDYVVENGHKTMAQLREEQAEHDAQAKLAAEEIANQPVIERDMPAINSLRVASPIWYIQMRLHLGLKLSKNGTNSGFHKNIKKLEAFKGMTEEELCILTKKGLPLYSQIMKESNNIAAKFFLEPIHKYFHDCDENTKAVKFPLLFPDELDKLYTICEEEKKDYIKDKKRGWGSVTSIAQRISNRIYYRNTKFTKDNKRIDVDSFLSTIDYNRPGRFCIDLSNWNKKMYLGRTGQRWKWANGDYIRDKNGDMISEHYDIADNVMVGIYEQLPTQLEAIQDESIFTVFQHLGFIDPKKKFPKEEEKQEAIAN